MPPLVALRGQRELLGALRHADRDTRLGIRRSLGRVAEPVAHDAEQLATSTVRRMPRSPRWAKMRVGVTAKLVYVAPRQRGVKRKGDVRRRRPNLADLLMARAMEPALAQHAHQIEGVLAATLDEIADDFNRGGPL